MQNFCTVNLSLEELPLIKLQALRNGKTAHLQLLAFQDFSKIVQLMCCIQTTFDLYHDAWMGITKEDGHGAQIQGTCAVCSAFNLLPVSGVVEELQIPDKPWRRPRWLHKLQLGPTLRKVKVESKHSKDGHFVGSHKDCPSVVQSEKLHTCSGMQGYIYGVVKLVGAGFSMSNLVFTFQGRHLCTDVARMIEGFPALKPSSKKG